MAEMGVINKTGIFAFSHFPCTYNFISDSRISYKSFFFLLQVIDDFFFFPKASHPGCNGFP